MDEIRSELNKLKKWFLGTPDPWGGRSAEINARVARLMGHEVRLDDPKDEYAEYAKLAKRADQI